MHSFPLSQDLSLTSFPPELMITIASSLDPRSILALIHTSPTFSYLFCVFTSRYTGEQDVGDQNYTPLQYFVSSGAELAVLHLLELGANPNDASLGYPKFQKAPLIHAIRFGRASMVSLLLRYGSRVEDRDDTGCWNFYRRLIPERLNNDGFSPLHTALMQPRQVYARHSGASEGSGPDATELQQIVQLLLDGGADVEARTEQQHTALHIACGMRTADPIVINSLIAAGADLNCKTLRIRGTNREYLMQPIHYAALAGNTVSMRILLGSGVDVEVETSGGMRALDLAIVGMHTATFEMVVEAGAITSSGGGDGSVGNASSMLANSTTWKDLLRWLRFRGWNLDIVCLKWWTGQPVHGNRPRKQVGFRRDW